VTLIEYRSDLIGCSPPCGLRDLSDGGPLGSTGGLVMLRPASSQLEFSVPALFMPRRRFDFFV
jgi:hypothetical protein